MTPRVLPFAPVTQGLFTAALALAIAVGCTTTVVNGDNGSRNTGEQGGRRESTPCKRGGTTLPIEAFDLNEDESTGSACNVGNVLDEDGAFAALDWTGGGTRTIAGREVAGCLAVEFSDGVTLNSLSMNMRPVGSGCGHACTPGSKGCGSGGKVLVFAGPSLDELDYVQGLPLTTNEMFEYRITIYERFEAKFAAICRDPTSAAEGDDIAIESVYGFCR